MSDISIYVHFPFCKKKCAYCAFYSVCVKSDAIFDAYSDALCRQIAALPAFCAKTIYFGGGTPTLMGARRLCRMLDKIFAAVSISADCEITFETNPNTVDLGMLKYLKVAGFNRVSAGLQSTDRDTLKLLGRTHTAADFTRFYSDATDSGFDNIAVDIMFALPSKTGDELAKTIEYVKTLDPKHISAYSLQIEEKTPFFKKRQSLNLPSEDCEESEYSLICKEFCHYSHYEISSFAKSGFESKHNSAYWDMSEYIGLGAAAHSFLSKRRFSAPADVNGYIKAVSNDFTSPTNFADSRPEQDSELDDDRIMLALRTSKGAKLNCFQLKKAKIYADGGFGEISGDVFWLNERGFRVSNKIISDILY